MIVEYIGERHGEPGRRIVAEVVDVQRNRGDLTVWAKVIDGSRRGELARFGLIGTLGVSGIDYYIDVLDGVEDIPESHVKFNDALYRLLYG